MDVQYNQSPQSDPVLHVKFTPDQLDNVVNLPIVQLVVLVQSLRTGFDGLRYILGPVELRYTQDSLTGVSSYPVNTLRFRVLVFCSDYRLSWVCC